MKILFVKRDKIGDMLLMTPMLRHLRSVMPTAEIHVLANTYNAWVLEGNPDVDRVWVYERIRGRKGFSIAAAWRQLLQLWAMRRENFDVAIAAGGVVSWRAIKRAQQAGAKRTIAYCDPGQTYGISDPLPLPAGKHEVEGNFGLLAPLGIPAPDQAIYPVFALDEKWRSYGQQWLATRKIPEHGYVVVGLNSRKAARKPSAAQIQRWAAHFKSAWGLDTVLMWQPGPANDPIYPGDDDYVKPVLDAGLTYLHPFSDASSIMPALGVVWHAAASIFPDSGITHLAALSPGSALSLFTKVAPESGPSHWRPYAPCARYLEADAAVTELSDESVYAQLEAIRGCAATKG